jgi:hypothetical protein
MLKPTKPLEQPVAPNVSFFWLSNAALGEVLLIDFRLVKTFKS